MSSSSIAEIRRLDQGLCEIHVQQRYAAPRDKVFAFFAVHENLMLVFNNQIRRIQDAPAGDNPNGLGSVRSITMGPGLSFEERIETFVDNELIEYRVTKGSPVKNHLGQMRFADDPQGTVFDYRIRLQGRIPGTTCLIAFIMRRALSQGLSRVQAQIEAA